MVAQRCGLERAIPDDLLGRGRWACTLPAGHDGPHGCVLGGEVCRWGDDGFALPGDPDALDIDSGEGADYELAVAVGGHTEAVAARVAALADDD